MIESAIQVLVRLNWQWSSPIEAFCISLYGHLFDWAHQIG